MHVHDRALMLPRLPSACTPTYSYPRFGWWTATAIKGDMGFGRTDDGVTWEALPSPLMDPPLDSETGAVEFFRFVAFSLVDEQLCSRAAKQSITQGALRIMPTVERVVNYALAETFTYSHISQKHIHASTRVCDNQQCFMCAFSSCWRCISPRTCHSPQSLETGEMILDFLQKIENKIRH